MPSISLNLIISENNIITSKYVSNLLSIFSILNCNIEKVFLYISNKLNSISIINILNLNKISNIEIVSIEETNYKYIYQSLYNKSKFYGLYSIFIDTLYCLEINNKATLTSYFESNKNTLYVSKIDDQYLSYILFAIENNSTDNIELIAYSNKLITKNLIFMQYNKNKNEISKLIYSDNYIDQIYFNFINKQYFKVIALYKHNNLNIKNIDNTDIKWYIYYLSAISYYKLENYKEAKMICNLCNNIKSDFIETDYLFAKIAYNNNRTDVSLAILDKHKNILTNKSKFYICKPNIYKHLISYQLFKCYKDSDNYPILDKLINKILDHKIPDKISNSINEYLSSRFNNLYLDKLINNKYKINDIQLNYNYQPCYYAKNNSDLLQFYFHENNLNLKINNSVFVIKDSKLSNNTTFYIPDNKKYVIIEFNSGSIVNYEINRSSFMLERKSVNKLPDKLVNYKWVTKLVKLNNILIGIIKDYECIYRFCYINIYDYTLISFSDIIPLGKNIQDIFLSSDNLDIVYFDNYISLPIDNLYLAYNIPINLLPNINNKILYDIKINIKIPNYDIPKTNYKNYIITEDNPDESFCFDIDNNILTNNKNNYSIIVDKFYFIKEISTRFEKIFTVSFYSNKTDQELENYLDLHKISIDSDIRLCKYLIIDINELNKSSSYFISKLINNNVLIIVLIEENLLDDISSIYSENKFLNKLFIFNIVKNSEYKEYILKKIIEDNQYQQRSKYFDIDKNNIYNRFNITKTIIEFNDKIDRYIVKNDEYLKLNSYISDILTQLHSKTENLNLIEIFKFIIINKHNITLLYETTVDRLLYQINFLGYTEKIDNLTLENFDKRVCVIVLDHYANFNKILKVCEYGSLVYIKDFNKLTYLIK